ncbi:phosphatidate cytidylyltransferase [Mycoplasmopsis ciconiae]|uniref:Phosphatidate cytidylyltransferase n=1 Tax=Mycoplasmopsis ciconiae TaxID=561067 RepID=A0ABU7ML86_9BACT|nr:phosphatidate cytidylyltransferase [Mycoplasmopsis ciconiae]
METKENKKSLFKSRILPGIAMIVFAIFFFVGGYFIFQFNNSQSTELQNYKKILRLVFLGIFALFLAVVSYEFINSFDLPIYISLIISLFVSSTMLFIFIPVPWVDSSNQSYTLILSLNQLSFKSLISGNWHTEVFSLISIFCASAIYLLFKLITVKGVNVKNILIKTLIILVTFFIISLAVRFMYYSYISQIQYLLLFVLISISSDIAGFFGGRYFGHKFFKRKLAPYISPKKTIEGAISSIVIAFLVAISIVLMFNLYSIFESDAFRVVQILIQLFFLIVLAILGDLYFSLIKRINNKKDYSNIFLGHGGFLDRFDSILIVVAMGSLYILS